MVNYNVISNMELMQVEVHKTKSEIPENKKYLIYNYKFFRWRCECNSQIKK